MYANSYDANACDIEYSWLFVSVNTILENGRVLLKFPPKNYNLEGNPKPFTTIVEGLEPIDGVALTYQYLINVVYIDGFLEVPAGTLIHIKITRLRNPSEEGTTNYFQIETQNQEQDTIDEVLNIPGIFIKKGESVG